MSTAFYNPQLIELLEKEPIFKKQPNISDHHELRHITFQRLQRIIHHKLINVFDLLTNPDVFFTIMNTLHLYDLSLAIKVGVNFGLFGAGLLRLGNPEQIKPYLEKLNTGEIFGCLAITEIGHGSNLKKLETTVIYNPTTQIFILNTPTNNATKCWIGNAACHATYAIVFAQLIFYNENKGLHAFIVNIRQNSQVNDNIRINDNGIKKGLNGVDNAEISFNNVILPLSSLLTNFGYIENDKYIPFVDNNDDRFGCLLSTLSGGRGVLASGSVVTSVKALIIACKYGQERRQFSGKDGIEKPIITYTSHQLKLMPLLSKTIVLTNAILEMKRIGIDDFRKTNKITKRVHALSSGLKVLCSEHAEKCCRVARLCCGGHGYSLNNEIALMHNDIDIYQTFEGDNTLLRQEICKYELSLLYDQIGDNVFRQKLYYIRMRTLEKLTHIKLYFTGSFIYPYKKPEYFYNLIKYKTKYLTLELVDSLLYYTQTEKREAFDAWNMCLDKVLDLADTIMYKKIYKMNKNTNEREWLLLFCYDVIYQNITWYFENEIITSNDVKRIISKRRKLSRYLTLDIDRIFKNFNVPDFITNVQMITQISKL